MPKCCDIDNFLKLFFDSLVFNEVIEDDKNIMELQIKKIITLRKD